MASGNLKKCEEHHDDEKAKPQGIQGKFYKGKLGKRDVIVNCIEIKFQELHHQNIIQIFDFKVVKNHFHIETEHCGFNLRTHFDSGRSIDRSQEAKLDILHQIGKGLKYLHNHNKPIIHGNLSPQNVLIKQSTDKVIVRLSDFYFQGVSHDTNPTKFRYCITPEVSVTTAVDIYAYGCLIHTVLTDSFDKSYDENFFNNVAQGTRMNKLFPSTINKESDFLTLAVLAIDDCTDAKFRRRPSIDTLIKHPMFWTIRKKELFFHGMYSLLKGAKPPKLPKFNIGKGESENKDVIKYMVVNFGDNSCKMNYKKLVFFIRNTLVHFRERKERLEEVGYEHNILTSGKTEFIRYVIAGYPNLVADLFKVYRRYFIKHTLDRGECVGHTYNSYFENLGKQILKTTWRSIADKSTINVCDIEGLWYEELKPYVAIELAVKFILQCTGDDREKNKNLFTSIVNKHMPQMSEDYRNSIKHKFSDLEAWRVKAPKNKSCQYAITADTCKSLIGSQTIKIKRPKEKSNGYTFSKTNLQNSDVICCNWWLEVKRYYWWLEVKGREITKNMVNYGNNGTKKNKMHSFLMDSDDELANILQGSYPCYTSSL